MGLSTPRDYDTIKVSQCARKPHPIRSRLAAISSRLFCIRILSKLISYSIFGSTMFVYARVPSTHLSLSRLSYYLSSRCYKFWRCSFIFIKFNSKNRTSKKATKTRRSSLTANAMQVVHPLLHSASASRTSGSGVVPGITLWHFQTYCALFNWIKHNN